MVKSKFSLQGKLLFAISSFFSLWVLNYFIQWTIAYVTPDFLSWQLTPIFMLLMFFFSLYFVYVFLENKDASLSYKIISALFFLPIAFLVPSNLNIQKFDLTMCEGVVGDLWKYIYMLEALIIVFIIIIGIKKYFLEKKDKHIRKEIIFLTVGMTFFLGISWISDVLGEWTKQYQINFIGPIGMVIFIGFLAFLIVKFKIFNIKLIATQALVTALVILIGSELFFADTATNQILILITLALSLGFGYILIKSIKTEVRRKEELQIMTNKLAQANGKLIKLDNAKSEFISIASHQLRTPLTAIKGFISLLLEESYGHISPEIKETLNKVYLSNERLIALVEDLLNLSRIESGRMEYKYEKVDMPGLIKEIYDTFIIRAKEKNLKMELNLPEKDFPEVETDRNKIREVISNLVDNALKYTQKGWVKIKLYQVSDKVQVAIMDTGIGVPKGEVPYLFTKFSRGKDINRLNTSGLGLGLHVGRHMIESLHGRIWVESEGKNRGSTFFVEVPIEKEEEEEEQ